jgi:hypothetical protein
MDDKVDEILSAVRELGRTNITDTALAAAEVLGIVQRFGGYSRRAASAGEHIELSGGQIATTNYDRLLGAAMRGEGRLSVGEPLAPSTSVQDTASEVVAMMLRQAGLDISAMGVMKADESGVWVYVPHSIHNSVLQKVRAALKTTLPNSPQVDFYTSGDTEMKLIDPDASDT